MRFLFYTDRIVLQRRLKEAYCNTLTHQRLCCSHKQISNVANDPDQNILNRHNWRVLEAFVHMQVTDLLL